MNPEPVEPPSRQLTAVGVQRQLTIECDSPAALDEGPDSPLPQKPRCFEPRHREEAEAVVQLHDIDIGRLEIGTRPEVSPGVTRCIVVMSSNWSTTAGHGSAVPTASTRGDPGGRLSSVLDRRHHESRGAVDRTSQFEQTEGRRDHAGREVVVERHRVAGRAHWGSALRCGDR